jgi:uncharacterized protein (TIRG00374 family)
MNPKIAFLGFVILALGYAAILVWIDSKGNVLQDLSEYFDSFPSLLMLATLSYFTRYLRWNWLMCRSHGRISFAKGFLAYLSGFALTASPGKVGELIRIRYFNRMGVPSWKVFAGFVFERTLDVLVVFLLCLIGFNNFATLIIPLCFVFMVVGIIILLIRYSVLIPNFLSRLGASGRLFEVSKKIRDGFQGVKVWLTPLDITVAFSLGVIAWLSVAGSFVVLLGALDIEIPIYAAFSLYPMALLVGAGSMIPGGFGTTEATIVALLSIHGVTLELALLAAIGIRICSIWFAMLLGFCAIALLELLGFFGVGGFFSDESN